MIDHELEGDIMVLEDNGYLCSKTSMGLFRVLDKDGRILIVRSSEEEAWRELIAILDTLPTDNPLRNGWRDWSEMDELRLQYSIDLDAWPGVW